jgi:nucleoside-diphosphate-sugar epimerase
VSRASKRELAVADERVLVTGGTGCIGSWIVKNLLQDDVPVIVLTASHRSERLRLILTDEQFDRISFVTADILDMAVIESAARQDGVNRIVHLAAIQLPFCAADSIRGAQLNVAGTIAIFELAKRLGIERVIYASSAAVYGPKTHYEEAILGSDAPLFPTSHYGVFKVANEESARVYWQDDGISSIGLRPHPVYGPGRDQGMTSKPTVAMIAAAAGRPYRIGFNGRYQFQFADDTAKAFLRALRSPLEGAAVYNLGGTTVGIEDIVRCIETNVPEARGRITFSDRPLALPEAFDSRPIIDALGAWTETPLERGVQLTLDCYRAGLHNGTVNDAYLDRLLA